MDHDRRAPVRGKNTRLPCAGSCPEKTAGLMAVGSCPEKTAGLMNTCGYTPAFTNMDD